MREVSLKLWIMAAACGLLALSGEPVQAQESAEPTRRLTFDIWGTGNGAYSYHRLSGNCDTVDHAHGRNAAWGRWIMPLAEILEAGPEEGEHGGAVLRVRCADGTACIRRGRLTDITGTASEHALPFETLERASIFARRIADLKAACAAG